MFADNNRIGNEYGVDNRFRLFFQKAKLLKVDLALIPEYSCPWNVIKEIAGNHELWPTAESLWAIGCESTTLDGLTSFVEKFSGAHVIINFDESVLDKPGRFLDPLIYLFITKNNDVEKLAILIQFKTQHMGVWGGTLERNNLIEGKKIYVLRNSKTSVRLLTLICSEAMVFQQALTDKVLERLEWFDKPFLVLNLQCNPKPIFTDFINFRNFILSHDKKELITLNWGNQSKFKQKALIENNSSRSGFFIKSTEIESSPQRLKYNHKKGLYYFSKGKNKHFYIFNSGVDMYFVSNMPVHITEALEVLQRRDGPTVLNIFNFDATGETISEITIGVSDQHIAYLQNVDCSSAFLTNEKNCILEKEILVSLATGNIHMGDLSWNIITRLYALQTGDTEENNRITFLEDSDPRNVVVRSKYIESIDDLENRILNDPANIPESIRDLKGNQLKIGFYPDATLDGYKYNVTDEQGNSKNATICFLGSVQEPVVEKVYESLKSLFDKSSNNGRRVVVYYRRGQMFHSKFDELAGRMSLDERYDPDSFNK